LTTGAVVGLAGGGAAFAVSAVAGFMAGFGRSETAHESVSTINA
jgi:hypothetical protein